MNLTDQYGIASILRSLQRVISLIFPTSKPQLLDKTAFSKLLGSRFVRALTSKVIIRLRISFWWSCIGPFNALMECQVDQSTGSNIFQTEQKERQHRRVCSKIGFIAFEL